jgi:DNA polymerase
MGADAELASLAAALRSAVRHRRLLGIRTTARPAEPAPRRAEPPVRVQRPVPMQPAAPMQRPVPMQPAAPMQRPARTQPAAPMQRPARTQPAASRASQVPPDSPALAALRRAAREVREKAAACADLESLRSAVAACTACGLCRSRKQTVFADGTGGRRVMFVGEAPGFHEDQEGLPFVGPAGALLTDIITKGMGLAREDVYVANVLKCRPPENRDPSDSEKQTCTPWLDRQIELVDPRVIIPLGRHAAHHVLRTEAPMGELRGRVHDLGGRKVIPTYHPAYLLRSPEHKNECWQDIQLALRELGLPIPPRPDRSGNRASGPG